MGRNRNNFKGHNAKVQSGHNNRGNNEKQVDKAHIPKSTQGFKSKSKIKKPREKSAKLKKQNESVR